MQNITMAHTRGQCSVNWTDFIFFLIQNITFSLVLWIAFDRTDNCWRENGPGNSQVRFILRRTSQNLAKETWNYLSQQAFTRCKKLKASLFTWFKRIIPNPGRSLCFSGPWQSGSISLSLRSQKTTPTFSCTSGVCWILTKSLQFYIFRNQMLAWSFLLGMVQILDFLKFHHMFGPWAIIISSLLVDLGKFMTVLCLFLIGFSMLITAMNTPFFDENMKDLVRSWIYRVRKLSKKLFRRTPLRQILCVLKPSKQP